MEIEWVPRSHLTTGINIHYVWSDLMWSAEINLQIVPESNVNMIEYACSCVNGHSSFAYGLNDLITKYFGLCLDLYLSLIRSSVMDVNTRCNQRQVRTFLSDSVGNT